MVSWFQIGTSVDQRLPTSTNADQRQPKMTNDYFRSTRATNAIQLGHPRRRKSNRGRPVLTLVVLVLALSVIGSPWFDLQMTKVIGMIDVVVDMVLLQAH